MATTTTNGEYPIPEGTDSGDVPFAMQQLAQEVEDKALIQDSGSRKRVHIETGLTATTDSSGYATFNHGAPFTPRVCQVVIVKNAFSLGYVISHDTPTATQVVARFGSWSATTTLNSQALGANAITIISWE